MQHKPDTGEQKRELVNTTPLSPHTNITSFPTAHPWEGAGVSPRGPRGYALPIVGVFLVLLAVVVIVITSPLGQGWLSAWHTTGARSSTSTPVRTVGAISFESSEQATADELQINLAGIPTPDPGNSYYGWLLPDKQSEARTPATALGSLPVEAGGIRVLYKDRRHRNLVGLSAAFLITEGKTASPPLQPSPDQATWRFLAAFPPVPVSKDTLHHFDELDLLRYLLLEEPSLARLGLHGGLEAWFYRNIQKVFESAGAAQGYFGQPQALSLLRSHLALILDYLDGGGNAWLDLGTRPAVPVPFGAQVGLIQITSTAPVPPAVITQIYLDLNGVIAAPGVPAILLPLSEGIVVTLAHVSAWLRQLRADVRELAAMTDTQLMQARAQPLLNDADTMAQYAFIGQASPAANAVMGGATQIHFAILRLATLPVQVLALP